MTKADFQRYADGLLRYSYLNRDMYRNSDTDVRPFDAELARKFDAIAETWESIMAYVAVRRG